ncbi:MAG TPA: hypothetical protein VKZ93_06755 [Arenibacter sp.]|nr:hypothetical protein [Arenibacter sp.]
MDYTIYIILGFLVIVYFVTQGLNRKKSKARKSRDFMEGYKKGDSKKTTKDRESEK